MRVYKYKKIFVIMIAAVIFFGNVATADSFTQEADSLRAELETITDKNSEHYLKVKQRLQRVIQLNKIEYSQSARFEDALRLINEEKYNSAIYELKALIEEKYQISKCYELLGDICEKRKKTIKKIGYYYSLAYESDSGNYSAALKLANLYIREDKIAPAISFISKAVENCDDAQFLTLVAEYIKNSVHPKDKLEANSLYDILGCIYEKLNLKEEAYKSYVMALRLNPDDIFLKYKLANLYYHDDEEKNAINVYDVILSENPKETAIRTSKAKALASAGNLLGADSEYRKILDYNPNSTQAKYGLYKLYEGKLPPDKILAKIYSGLLSYVPTKKDALDFAKFLDNVGDSRAANMYREYVHQIEIKEKEELEQKILAQKIAEQNLLKKREEERAALIAKKQAEEEKARQEELLRKQAEAEKARQEELKNKEIERKLIEDNIKRKQEQEKLLKQKELEQEQLRKQKEQDEKLLKEKQLREAKEKARQEELLRKQAEAEKARQEQIAQKQAEAERLKQEAIIKEKARQEEFLRTQVEAEKLRQEQIAQKQAEIEKAKQEELLRKQAEAEKLKQEAVIREKARQEELLRKQAEAEKARQEELKKKEIERKLIEDNIKRKQEQEKLLKQKELEQEQLRKQKEQDEKLLKEKQLREAKEKARQEELLRKQAEAEKARQEQIAQKQAEAERLKQEAIIKEKARQEELRKKQEEAEAKKKAKDELEAKAKLEKQQKEYEEKTMTKEKEKSLAKDSKRYRKLEAEINKYLAIEPKDANTYIAIANTYKQMEMPVNALKYYKEALKLNPTNSDIYYNLAITYMELNSLVTSKANLIKAINLDKDNAKAKNLLGFVNQKLITKIINDAFEKFDAGNYVSAFEILDDGIKQYPNTGQLYYYRALVFDKMNRNAAQIIDLQKAIEFNPEFYMAYYQLGLAYEKINDERSALFAYEKFLSTEPEEKDLVLEVQKKVELLSKKYY